MQGPKRAVLKLLLLLFIFFNHYFYYFILLLFIIIIIVIKVAEIKVTLSQKCCRGTAQII